MLVESISLSHVSEEGLELEFFAIQPGPSPAAGASFGLNRPIGAGVAAKSCNQMISPPKQGQNDFLAGIVGVSHQVHRFGQLELCQQFY